MLYVENGAALTRAQPPRIRHLKFVTVSAILRNSGGRETVRLLIKDEPIVVRVRLARRKSMTRYSVPESVARRVHTRLFNPLA